VAREIGTDLDETLKTKPAWWTRIMISGFRSANVIGGVVGVQLLAIIVVVVGAKALPISGDAAGVAVAVISILLLLLWIYVGNRVARIARAHQITRSQHPGLVVAARVSSGFLAEIQWELIRNSDEARRLAGGTSLSIDEEGLRLWTNPPGRPRAALAVPWSNVSKIRRSGSAVRPTLSISLVDVRKDLEVAFLADRPFSAERIRGRSFLVIENVVVAQWECATGASTS
jgi:hypothetical protein